MFLPIGQESRLNLPGPGKRCSEFPVISLVSNREKIFIAVVTTDTVYIWLTNPCLLLCSLKLTDSEVLERGYLQKVYWRYDSSSIAITTTRNNILIYRVDVSSESCYNLTDSNESVLRRTSQELFLRGRRPIVSLFPSVVINLAATATCCVPLREELLVCVRNGFCHHVAWDGSVHSDYSIRLTSVPFAHDQLQSKPEFVSDSSIHVIDAVYAPLIGGYCIVLSDGRAALLTSSDSKFHPNSLLGVWALHMKDARCTDVNHKFRLLVFGCQNGDVAGYHLDDANGSLIQTFRVPLKVTNGPEISNRLGPVLRVQVLSTGAAMAAIWGHKTNPNENGNEAEKGEEPGKLPPTLAIFTPFGAQSWSSLECTLDESDPVPSAFYTSLDWSAEGCALWLGRNDGLSTISIARSAGCGNPVMEHSERVVLLSCSRVLISPERRREELATAPHTVWTTLHAPNEYISANWPLRFASLDSSCKTLVVAGARGIAHCNVGTGRWKIFGNESQESDLIVTGGVFVWNGTVAAACHDSSSDKEFIRFYPLSTKLDNRFASSVETEARTLMLSTRSDSLVTFDTESRILLFKMRRMDDGSPESTAKVILERQAEIRVADLITHPACLVSIQLTQLNLESGGGSFFAGVDTVLVNVSGRLITLNPKNTSRDDDERFQLNQPIMVASFVEQVWHDCAREEAPSDEETPAHLRNALWINCGTKGMRVWLPLFPGRRNLVSQETSFISKRIMLPFELDICPSVMCSSDCLAIGVESIPSFLTLAGNSVTSSYSPHRNSEVFVHHLLRQLLKRNLGVFALEVAGACRRLAHFPHSLELLLHGVLEEEATSSEPIPDPLLPRCVAFIQEFPEFLRTVAHCARKTEIALWSSLFSVTGSPNDLFEVCLRDGQLQTAASYLIVLQNLESTQTSLEQAARLLREALSAGSWTIASDMIRFARAIDSEDLESQSRTPPQKSASRRPTASLSLNSGEANELVFSRFQAAGRVSKVRHTHEHKESSRKDSTGSGGKRVARALSNDTSPPSPTSLTNPMAEKMDLILEEHGSRLLEEYCIRDLGFFCAHLSMDVRRVAFHRPVSDFPLALTRLHSQFTWPYPVPGKHVVDQLERRFGAMVNSRSSASLNGLVESPKIILPTRGENVELASVSVGSDTGETVSVKEAKLVPVKAEVKELNGNTVRSPSPTNSLAQTIGTSDGRSGGGSNEWQGVDLLVGESSGRGSSSSQKQLQHMLQLFSEAGAGDWVLLICVVRRDIAKLREEISATCVAKWGVEGFGRIRLGSQILLDWATHNCLGYVPVLQLFSAHLEMVAEKSGCLNLPPKQEMTNFGHQNGTSNSEKTLVLSDVRKARRNVSRKDPLGDSYRPRERSRSMDRASDHVVNASDDGERCSLM